MLGHFHEIRVRGVIPHFRPDILVLSQAVGYQVAVKNRSCSYFGDTLANGGDSPVYLFHFLLHRFHHFSVEPVDTCPVFKMFRFLISQSHRNFDITLQYVLQCPDLFVNTTGLQAFCVRYKHLTHIVRVKAYYPVFVVMVAERKVEAVEADSFTHELDKQSRTCDLVCASGGFPHEHQIFLNPERHFAGFFGTFPCSAVSIYLLCPFLRYYSL